MVFDVAPKSKCIDFIKDILERKYFLKDYPIQYLTLDDAERELGEYDKLTRAFYDASKIFYGYNYKDRCSTYGNKNARVVADNFIAIQLSKTIEIGYTNQIDIVNCSPMLSLGNIFVLDNSNETLTNSSSIKNAVFLYCDGEDKIKYFVTPLYTHNVYTVKENDSIVYEQYLFVNRQYLSASFEDKAENVYNY